MTALPVLAQPARGARAAHGPQEPPGPARARRAARLPQRGARRHGSQAAGPDPDARRRGHAGGGAARADRAGRQLPRAQRGRPGVVARQPGDAAATARGAAGGGTRTCRCSTSRSARVSASSAGASRSGSTPSSSSAGRGGRRGSPTPATGWWPPPRPCTGSRSGTRRPAPWQIGQPASGRGRPVHILQLTDLYTPVIGGLERHVATLSARDAAARPHGHRRHHQGGRPARGGNHRRTSRSSASRASASGSPACTRTARTRSTPPRPTRRRSWRCARWSSASGRTWCTATAGSSTPTSRCTTRRRARRTW